MGIRLLIVEDDESLREVLLEAAALEGFSADGFPTAEAALTRLANQAFDVCVTDVTLPGMSGLDLLPQMLRLQPNIIAIVMTAYGTIEVAVEAMKRGASDFLTKPIALDNLTGAIRVAAEHATTQARASSQVSGRRVSKIIYQTAVMQRLLDQVNAIAPFNTTVLVTGETGTGKEMIARSIHEQSPRCHRPLIALNCAAVPEQLLEDELFGHIKGAFTGAQVAREGRFEQADGSTLFLDEIGDMSLPLQSKLLRVLQEREFERLGSSRTIKVDVRIIAATSANIEKRIEEGTFRPDLYYRLNVVHLSVPPLRERKDDIRPLADALLYRFCESMGLPDKNIADGVWDALHRYHWPGNVRQLQNAIERAAALTGMGTGIGLSDLPEEVRAGSPTGITAALAVSGSPSGDGSIPDEGLNFEAVVTKVERELLLRSLNKAGGNKMRAAKLLNMKRTTFVEKLKRLQIEVDEDSERTQAR